MRWIDDGPSLERALAAAGAATLALDCEADSLHHYPEKLCLVQLSAAGEDWLIDPLAFDLAALRPALEDRARPKILHGADYDLRLLGRDLGFRVAGLFDTMLAARLVGERAFGLAALLDKYLGVSLDKKHQTADWSRRPLPAELQRYAVADTHHLQPLAAALDERLRALGRRSWADEEFLRLESIRWRETPDPEAWRRVRGAAGLDRRGLAVVRELYSWRDGEARRRDTPPFRVLSDERMAELARRVA
ncbi:MAG TPA: ribonuclease D, partial [Candidatus Polarisedimenticolaceae bacterium]|nr:ribonuclease D [Candidatus Polarisedimenticolaceae bacterium]